MANTTISTMLATTAVLALAACGGGSSAVNNNPTLPSSTSPNPVDGGGGSSAINNNPTLPSSTSPNPVDGGGGGGGSAVNNNPTLPSSTSPNPVDGGGGGSAINNNSTDTTTLPIDVDDQTTVRIFSDNSGIIRYKATADGVTGTVATFAPDYRTFNTENGIFPVDTDAAGVTLVSTSAGFTQYGEYGRVNYRYNGSLNNIFIYVNDNEDVGLAIVEGPLAHAAMAAGSELLSLPNGSFTYRGDAFTKSRSELGVEEGTFSLTANFVLRTANIEAQTATTQLSGTNLSINSTGEISGANLTMTVLGQTSTSAGLEGNFHGQSASGVSGIYYNNASNPTHIGAFAGTR